MANQIELVYAQRAEQQLKDILKGLQDIHREQLSLNQLALNINAGNSSNPQELQRMINLYNDLEQRYQALEQRLQSLNTQRAEQTRQQRTANQRTSEEIVNQRALAQNADRNARANSRLAGAMANLNAQHQIARQRLQDLIASQTASNRQIRQAQREYDALDRRVVAANRAVRQFNYNVGNYPRQAITGIRNLIGAFGVAGGISLFAGMVTDIFNTTKELQGLDNALKQVTGTNEQFARSQAFLRDVSETYGLEIKGLTRQFTQFYVSAKDKLSGTEIENIFRSISKAGATMGLSVDAQNRAFTALNQMMSKGTIQAEELKGQLGEALPGAFGIMAKAIGKTEQEMAKMMKDGELLASEVLPKFAKQLEKTYGIENVNRVETLGAATNRLSNTWTDFIRGLEGSDGVISTFFKGLINYATATLVLLGKINTSMKKLFENDADKLKKENVKISQRNFDEELQLVKESTKEQTKIRKSFYESELNSIRKDITARTKRIESLQKEYSLAKNNIERSRIEEKLQAEKKLLEADSRYLVANKSRINAIDYFNKKQEESTKKVEKETKSTKENTDSKKNNNKIEEQKIELINGSIGWFEEKIKLEEKNAELIKQNSTVVLSENEEYKNQILIIEHLKKGLQNLIGVKEELDGVSLDLGGKEFITDEEGDALKKAGDDLRALIKEFQSSFTEDFINQSGFSKMFDIFTGGLDKFEGDAVSTALAVSDAFQQAFNTISEMSNNSFQVQYDNLEKQKDTSLLFAGESAAAREEIEKQSERRKMEIQRREIQQKKKLALFNIAIDTAQAIVASFKKDQSGSTAILIGTIGAIQAGLVASQQIPEFWKGTQNAPEGVAWTDERGAELHTDKQDRIKDFGSKKGARLKKLEKGDKIYTAAQTKKILDLYNFNSDFGNLMQTNGITITNEQKINFDSVNSRLDKLADVVSNKSEFMIVNSENGTKYFERKNGSRKELVNSVLTMKNRSNV